MGSSTKLRVFAAAILSALSGCVPTAFAAMSAEQDGTLPDLRLNRKTLDVYGDPARPVNLKLELVKPLGTGPFPLVVYNHGSQPSNPATQPSGQINLRYTAAIYYFLSRGYAVARPMLRGFDGSEGAIPDPGCDLAALGRANAKDVLSTLHQVANDPEIDATRIIVAGESYGGWNALALGTSGDSRIKAVVNFHGGLRSSGCKAGDKALVEGARSFGAERGAPSLWLYGDNDGFFSRPLWDAMYRAFKAAGGDADLLAYGKIGGDSHRLLSDPYAHRIFAPRLDTFLERLGLQTRITHPEFLQIPAPPASGYAAIDDVDAVPFMDDEKRKSYRDFLAKPAPKVFLISGRQAVFWTANGFDPLASGLALCRKNNLVCQPYAYNSDVVWTYPSPPPPATRFARLDDVGAVPHLDEAGRAGYRAFLKFEKPRAFVIAPDGGWHAVSGFLDPVAESLRACGLKHEGCATYAVDRSVVWPDKRMGTVTKPAKPVR